jgi:hypothetical protein
MENFSKTFLLPGSMVKDFLLLTGPCMVESEALICEAETQNYITGAIEVF